MQRLTMISVVAAGLLLWRAAAGFGSAPVYEEDKPTETIEVKHGGLTRTSLVYVPPSYNGKTPVPLVLSFHGRHGQGKNQAELTDLHKVGARQGFLVVYPDGVGKSWNAMHGTGEAQARGVDDVGFVDALLAKLSERYKIDPDRIYASGMSNGGFFTHRLGCERSDRFAAIATVAAEMAPALAKSCKPENPVPVIMFNGTKDRIAPYSGGSTQGGGASLSAEKTAEVWSRWNGCSSDLKETFRKGDVVGRSYQGCAAPVILYTVDGAGHTWPGGYQYMARLLVGSTNRDVNASEMIWQFFQEHPKRRAPRP